MLRSSALCTALALGGAGCSPEIVLGDTEAPLPVAAVSGGNATGAAAGASGSTQASGASGGSGGTSAMAGPGPDVAIPPAGDVIWSTDHEVGDFSDWQRGGAYYGGEYEWGDVNGYVDIGVGRDGSNGVVADINTGSRGEPSEGVRMYRRIEAAPAYYSAWFRLE